MDRYACKPPEQEAADAVLFDSVIATMRQTLNDLEADCTTHTFLRDTVTTALQSYLGQLDAIEWKCCEMEQPTWSQ